MRYRLLTAVIPIVCLTGPLAAQSTVGDALDGPSIDCNGAIAWFEDGTDPRMEAMRLAVAESGSAVALYTTESSFTPEDVWPCQDGLCARQINANGSATTSVLKLNGGIDLGDGTTHVELDAVFVIASGRSTPLSLTGATGKGAFICDGTLPAGLSPSAE